MGDPAGIGPEIVVKALSKQDIYEVCRPLVVGDMLTLMRTCDCLDLHLVPNAVDSPSQGRYECGSLDVIDLHNVDIDSLRVGEIQAAAGKAAFEYITLCTELALSRNVDAISTAPINKEAIQAAGIDFIGHTEMFGSLAGVDDPTTVFHVMNLRVFFLTRHVSLIDACKAVTRAAVVSRLRSCHEALRQLGTPDPLIAVAGLNPHCGEHGLFGNEEVLQIRPAVDEAISMGIRAVGPIPADSVFYKARQGAYDGVLSLYHDQGHIATKTLDFERTVSITCGLPFLRTSVDHGTAFDIAGRGTASSISMEEAILVAAKYAPRFRS
jgi:4-hydroxythreonine-4-phosphate dehydrogenase